MKYVLLFLLGVFCISCQTSEVTINKKRLPDEVRTEEIRELQFGMFICWSFSTFSGKEWTGEKLPADFFRATECHTDQWAKTAKKQECVI